MDFSAGLAAEAAALIEHLLCAYAWGVLARLHLRAGGGTGHENGGHELRTRVMALRGGRATLAEKRRRRMVITMPWRLDDFEPPLGSRDVTAIAALLAVLLAIVIGMTR